MSSNDKDQQPTEGESQEANAEIQPDIISEPASKSSKPALLIFVILLLFVLNGFLFWLINQQDSATKLGEHGLDQLETAVASFEQKSKANKSELSSEIQAIQSKLVNVGSAQKKLNSVIAELQNSNQLEREDAESAWTTAEVESLLKLANHRLLLASDVKGATTALQLSDKLLQALAEPIFYPLRSLIADEILLLESIDVPDVAGIASRLQSALNQVSSLKVRSAPVSNDGVDEQQAESTIPEPEWESVLNDTWEQMRSLVVIRHQQDGSQALLVPEQRYFLYQNLRLKLETARFALLTGQVNTYQESLQSASTWIQDYFVGSERDAMLVLLKKLHDENVQLVLPDISASLIWLQQWSSEQ